MRLILGCIFLLSVSSAFAACKVDGISDSPQKLNCTFPKLPSIRLSCVDDKYNLNWNNVNHKVQVAFHMDVEEGDSLLVFKAEKLTLTVDGKAGYLEAAGIETAGKCL